MRRSMTKAVLTTAVLTLLALPAQAGERQRVKMRTALDVWNELMSVPDKRVPERLLQDARCVAVIPGVIKGAFVWGGHRGKGVLTCRRGDGWSAPIFVNMTGGSFGFQIGGQAIDFVLFFVTDRSVKSLLKSEFTFGGDASVAAGPLGRSAEAFPGYPMRVPRPRVNPTRFEKKTSPPLTLRATSGRPSSFR